jgi:hypothetical protein
MDGSPPNPPFVVRVKRDDLGWKHAIDNQGGGSQRWVSISISRAEAKKNGFVANNLLLFVGFNGLFFFLLATGRSGSALGIDVTGFEGTGDMANGGARGGGAWAWREVIGKAETGER